MKNTLKRSLSVFLVLAIIFGSAYVGLSEIDFGGLFAVEAKAEGVDYLTFELNDDGESYSVDFCLTYASGDIVIPDTYNNLPVTGIGYEAFYCCESLTSITIPDSVTSIGDSAFYCCSSLETINFGSGVESIGSYAFVGCDRLKSINVDSGNLNYSSSGGVLFNKDKTTLVKFPEKKQAEVYIVPDGVKTIYERAFESCEYLKSVILPDGLESIEYNAFACCENLVSISITDSVTSIGSNVLTDTAYYRDESNWKNGALYAGNHLIEAEPEITGLYKVNPGTRCIADSAFSYRDGLTSLIIPDSVASICGYAFGGCNGLETVTIEGSVKIGWYAFRSCENLASLTIGGGANIGEEAFSNCESLESVKIGDGVTSIWPGAFSCLESLEYVEIGKGKVDIGENAFSGCASLVSIKIPDTSINIYKSSFENTGYYNNKSNWKNDALYIGKNLIAVDRDIDDSFKIAKGTTNIAGYAFNGCEKLTSITIPDTVTNIGEYAFSWDSNLAFVKIPDSVTNIGEGAFVNCDSLKSIEIPDSVTSINDSTFCYCSNLETVTIPDSVTSIGDEAFYWCVNIKSIRIPDSVTHIGDEAFLFCWQLKSIVIPDSVTRIGKYAFDACKSLLSVKIGKRVTSIGEGAFNKCESLKSISIPDNVKNIGKYAFGYFKDYNSIEKMSDFIVRGNSGSAAEDYAKENGFTFKAPCKHKSTKWVVEKKATVYESGSKYQQCKDCGEIIDVKIIPQLKCDSPEITAIANKDYGVKIVWYWIDGADSYKVYRKVSGGSYQYLGKTTKTAYADKTAKSGTKYYYVVKATNEAGDSEKSASKGITFLAKPTIKAIANKDYGVRLEWSKVSGADSYKVYRKTGSDSYKYLGKTTKTAYADKTAKSGKKYYYVVKTVKDSSASEKSEEKSITFVGTPTIKTPSTAKAGITVKWSKVSGAEGYIVYRKTGSGSYERLAKIKGGTIVSYIDKTAKKGKTYSYKIEAYKGGTKSAASAVKTIKDKY